MPSYNSVHRQQLFNWIGRSIDDLAPAGHLTDALRTMYVEHLRSTLEHGLWLKRPRDPDYIGDGSRVFVHRPIVCFTEWGLGQSLPHTKRYGRMGFGFSKRFVLNRGGQPVQYIRDATRDAPYSAALLAVAKWFDDNSEDLCNSKRFLEIRNYFHYIAHFSKKIRKSRDLNDDAKREKMMPCQSRKRHSPDLFARNFGAVLHYLEEREWRIVFDKSISRHLKKADGGANRPEYYLPFTPGVELFTVVMPDNETVSRALACEDIRTKLYPANAPHVTVLSLQDIGTF